MRASIVALGLVAACKGKAPPNVTLDVPTVNVATVFAADSKAPPLVLFVGDADDGKLAAAATWADFDAHDLRVAKRSGPLDLLHEYADVDCWNGTSPIATLQKWDKDTRTAIDIRALEAKLDAMQDDPPPPEAEDEADEEESAVPEGERNYKRPPFKDSPKRAREQAIAQARESGVFARMGGRSWSFPESRGRLNSDGTPSRSIQLEGEVALDGRIEKLCLLVAAAPTIKATRLIDVLVRTKGAIAVSHDGKIRPLNIQFRADEGFTGFGFPSYTSSSANAWLEVRVSTDKLVVEAVPDTPIEVGKPEELVAALATASTARGLDATALLDVLVDPDVDAQRLIDILVTLDAAGAGVIGLGSTPTGEELARRGHRVPTLHLGQPLVNGDLDKAKIRKVMKQNRAALRACYEPHLIDNPELAGTVNTQFFITPQGTVASVAASGVAVPVALCVQNVIARLVFPKPDGSDGAQVNYPFTFRPY